MIHAKLLDLFRLYLVVGGMPAAVSKYLETNNLQEVVAVQREIIRLYKWDISQYDYKNKLKIEEIFDLIASWYDPRINEDEEFDPSIEAEDDWIKKDLSYFFESVENPILYVEPDQKNRQLDTLYPNEDQLDYLAVMDDFPIDRRAQMLNMWEELKSTPLPTYVYIILAVAVVLLVGLIVGVLIKNRIVRHNRITRRKLRQETKKKSAQQLNN